jgi:NAD(P) transhydrogenase
VSVTFRFDEEVTTVGIHQHGTVTTLASGKQIAADIVMYAAGRQGCTEGLGLENTRLRADGRGRLSVDDNYRTRVGHIYAVGDVIGGAALAATSGEQGRLAAHHAFGEPVDRLNPFQPTGIYTIPEVSYIGATESELTANAIPYEVGVARYREIARGLIAGDSHGILKLLVSTDGRGLLGVHVFGSSATELVHIGQVLMTVEDAIDYLVDAVFNYPTFSETYKVAAVDVMNSSRNLNEYSS